MRIHSKGKTTKELAYATSSVTYAVFMLFIEIPKILSSTMKATAAKDLLTALTAKGFDLPASLETRRLLFVNKEPTPAP